MYNIEENHHIVPLFLKMVTFDAVELVKSAIMLCDISSFSNLSFLSGFTQQFMLYQLVS